LPPIPVCGLVVVLEFFVDCLVGFGVFAVAADETVDVVAAVDVAAAVDVVAAVDVIVAVEVVVAGKLAVSEIVVEGLAVELMAVVAVELMAVVAVELMVAGAVELVAGTPPADTAAVPVVVADVERTAPA